VMLRVKTRERRAPCAAMRAVVSKRSHVTR
jgi:hypothetical protein